MRSAGRPVTHDLPAFRNAAGKTVCSTGDSCGVYGSTRRPKCRLAAWSVGPPQPEVCRHGEAPAQANLNRGFSVVL